MEEQTSRLKTVAAVIIALLIIPGYVILRSHVLAKTNSSTPQPRVEHTQQARPV